MKEEKSEFLLKFRYTKYLLQRTDFNRVVRLGVRYLFRVSWRNEEGVGVLFSLSVIQMSSDFQY